MGETESRRNNWEVLKDILMVCKGGANITKIVYGANGNFAYFKDYLTFAEKRGLVREIGGYWHTTEKGLELVLRVLELQAILGEGDDLDG